MKSFRWFVFLCSAVFLVCFAFKQVYAENAVVNDKYRKYAEIYGNDHEISEIIEAFGITSGYEVYNPNFAFSTTEYAVRVPEIATDCYTIFANVELEVDATSGIVRPYEFSLLNSQYYTPVEAYGVPVYFFLANVSFDKEFEGGAGNWGITNDNCTMNRLEYQTGTHDSYEMNSDGTVDVYFLVTIARFNGEWTTEKLSFVIRCPITRFG